MNYYSIEFFKHNIKELNLHVKRCQKLYSKQTNLNFISEKLDLMLKYVKDREESNKDAYSKKHLKKLNFKVD